MCNCGYTHTELSEKWKGWEMPVTITDESVLTWLDMKGATNHDTWQRWVLFPQHTSLDVLVADKTIVVVSSRYWKQDKVGSDYFYSEELLEELYEQNKTLFKTVLKKVL